MFINSNLEELTKKYRENKLSHAYLIETNNLDLAQKDILTLIKYLNCPQEYTENCHKCNICNLINLHNLPSIKIITPDGANIKKNQIEELKENFSYFPIYSKYNIYIIKYAEKLNPASANSMLKFLEEPASGIIGFFLTTNKDVIIDTIKSRCQTFHLTYQTNNLQEKFNLTEEDYNNYIKTIQDYLKKVATNKPINHKKELLAIYSEKQEIEIILKIIFEIYNQNFLKNNQKVYQENITKIYQIDEKNTKLIKKLNIIANIIENLRYNINIEQSLDKFVIEMRDCNE